MTQATSQVITTADRSVKAVTVAVGSLQKVVAEMAAMGLVLETMTADIQQRESQLADIDRQMEVELRTAKANLNLSVLENEELTLQTLMGKHDLAHIKTDELTKLASELAAAQANTDSAVATAVTNASKELNSSWGAKVGAIENAHRVETATLKAESDSKNERISFLTGEIAALRAQIEAERNTRLAIAQADAGRQGVVVNAGKQ